MPTWIIPSVFGAAFLVAYKYLTQTNRRLRNEIKKHPLTTLADVREGEVVRLSGVVSYAGPALTAPISGRDCAAWHIVVWRLTKNDLTGVYTWVLVDDAQASQDFLLDDADIIRVDGSWIDLLLHADVRDENTVVTSLPPEFEAYLESRDLMIDSFSWGRRPYRVQEGVLEAGERVTVVGRAQWIVDPAHSGYRDGAKRLILGPMDDGRILASDEEKLAKAPN